MNSNVLLESNNMEIYSGLKFNIKILEPEALV